MAEDYLTDDEQLEHVKRLSAEYGPWVLGGVLLATALVFGFRYYEGYKNARALKAASQFSAMTAALERNDHGAARRIADGLIKDFANSPYADQAELAIARIYVDEGQLAGAVPALTQVMNGSKDSDLQQIARLRLARVLIDQGKPDEAIKTLAQSPAAAFAALYHEVRGDAYYSKKDLSTAAAEYQAALGASDARDPGSALLELKIADLGTAPAHAEAAAAKAPSADKSNKVDP
jgi:predicted negative regulator of RcsB-dependent stress response